MEVVLQSVTECKDESSNVQQWLTGGIVTVEELLLVTSQWAEWLVGRGGTLRQRLVEVNDLGESLGLRVGAEVLCRGDLWRDQGG